MGELQVPCQFKKNGRIAMANLQVMAHAGGWEERGWRGGRLFSQFMSQA